jgi:hypothetical protein
MHLEWLFEVTIERFSLGASEESLFGVNYEGDGQKAVERLVARSQCRSVAGGAISIELRVLKLICCLMNHL